MPILYCLGLVSRPVPFIPRDGTGSGRDFQNGTGLCLRWQGVRGRKEDREGDKMEKEGVRGRKHKREARGGEGEKIRREGKVEGRGKSLSEAETP